MIKKLTEFDKSEIVARIAAMTPSNYTSIKNALSGDHWQNQSWWVGPLALESDGTTSTAGMEIIEGKFVFENVLSEIVNRHISGVLGDVPHWQITPKRSLKPEEEPTTKEHEFIGTTEAATTVWWDSRTVDFTDDESKYNPFEQFAINLLSHGRGVLRIFVPSEAGETVSAATLEEALARIYVMAPAISQAGVITDKNSQEKLSTYFYNEVDADYIETSWVKNGVTYLKTVMNGDVSITQHKLRGKMFIYEARCPALITDSLTSLQKQLNMTLTMLGRNVNVGGSPETFFLNAMLPGRTQVVDGKTVYVADPVQTGAGVVHSYTGIPVKDGVTGQTSYTNPNVIFRDPVPVDTFVATVDLIERAMLSEAQQLHALIGGDATASGEARIQALADFENSLAATAKCVDGALQWVLESALTLAGAIMGNDSMFDEYRVMVQCNTNAGPVSTEMLRTLADVTDRNFISHETSLTRAGVQDTEAELQRIEMQKQQAMQEQQQMIGGNPAMQRILNGAASNQNQNGSNANGHTEQARR